MKDRILELRRILHEANHAYYVLNQPTMADHEFDKLLQDLIKLEKQFPECADPNSPTTRVGSDLTESFKKVRHTTPMLSLDNVFDGVEVVKFFNLTNTAVVVVEPKIDGLSLHLTYRKGSLVQAVTRGDGAMGDDVTANARTIKTIPLVLPEPIDLEVRGEVYMPREVFEELNRQREAEGDDLFANPRNAAAGTMKQKDPKEVAKRGLKFSAYFIVGPALERYESHLDVLQDLEKFGFNMPKVVSTGLLEDSIVGAIKAFSETRAEFDFDIDGLVFKLDSIKLQRELGLRSKSPRWACAYKFPPEQAITRLLGITVQVGRTGTLTPVAELEPIHLSGSTVKRASLCNQNEIARLGVNVGDSVIIVKAAEIIPKVVGLHAKSAEEKLFGHWIMPTTCPCCGTAVKQDAGMVAHYCPNEECEAQVFETLMHAVAKPALDIDGCGEALIRELIAKGVRRLSDLFAFDEKRIDGTAARERFTKSREIAKTQPLWRKLHALGVEGVGRSLSKELAQKFGSLENIVNNATEARSILGPVKHKSFFEYVERHADEIERLDSLGVTFAENRQLGGKLLGKVFCITGAMTTGSREQVQEFIENNGGACKSSVSKKVNFLILGEGAGANKSAQASKLGTQVISEADLYTMVGVPMPVVEDIALKEF